MLQTNLFGGVKWNVNRTETQNCWQISNIVCGRVAKIYFFLKIMVLFLLWKLSCRPPRVVEFKDNVLLRSLSMCTVGEKLKKIKGATSYRQLETENRHKLNLAILAAFVQKSDVNSTQFKVCSGWRFSREVLKGRLEYALNIFSLKMTWDCFCNDWRRKFVNATHQKCCYLTFRPGTMDI